MIAYLPVLTAHERMIALQLLWRGQVTVAELAKVLGVSRQALHELATKDGLKHMPQIRARYVAELWKRASGKR